MVSILFWIHPYLGKIPILTNIFQLGLVQPPPSHESWRIESFPWAQATVAAAVVLQALIDSPVIQVGYKYYGYKYYRKMILYSLYTNNIYIYDIHLYWNIMDSLGLIYHWFSSLSLLVLSLHDVKVPVWMARSPVETARRFRGHHRQPSAVSTDHLWGTSRRRCLLVDTEDELMSENSAKKEIRFEVLVDVEKKSSILIMKSDFQISKIVNMINMI